MSKRFYSMLGLCMKAGKLAYGTDMCMDKIKVGKAFIVLVATDASSSTKEKFKKICDNKKINYFELGNRDEISYAIRQE